VAARVPRLLFAAFDPGESWFTLILEDLRDARPGDEIEGCDATVAAAALDQMAALHAPCWEDPELASTGWVDRSSPEGDEFAAALVTGVFPGFLERYADRLDPEHVAFLECFVPRIRAWVARERGPRTIVHADFRLDNLLFTPDRPEPAVVDFQTISWGCGAYDLAYFVGGSLEPDVRRAAGDDLIAGYHRGLVDRGVEDYPLDALITDYRRECLGGLFMAVGASMLVKRTERGDRMFLTSVRRHAQQSLDLDALAPLDDT
jgi:aminoglycoside/choline kinase family phosphotransferase